MTTLAPIGASVFFINSGIQSFKSAQRIQDHAQGKSGIDKDKYKVQLMVEGAQQRAEKLMHGLAAQEAQDYLDDGDDAHPQKNKEVHGNGYVRAPKPTNAAPVPSGDDVSETGPKTEAPLEKENGANAKEDNDENHLAYGSAYSSRVASRAPSLAPSQHTLESTNGKEFPTLALTKEQFEMKESLDAVGFKKYPVHIHRANHSHAAIIVRMQRPGFGEGRVVSRHWTERFEV